MNQNKQTISRKARIFRFVVVGGINTFIDFAVTNLLVILLQPIHNLVFTLISLTACLSAMVCSYFLHRAWTFQSHHFRLYKQEVILFFLFAFLALTANTATFLLMIQFLSHYNLSEFLMVNVAKLTGVVVGMYVSFFCYCFVVFVSESFTEFRHQFNFNKFAKSKTSWKIQFFILIIITSSIRLIAMSFYRIQPTQELVWLALIPGILIILPITLAAHSLYGTDVAWIVGIFCSFNPWLISFSVNINRDMWPLFLLISGIVSITILIQYPENTKLSILWGFFFGLAGMMIPYAFLLFFFTLLLLMISQKLNALKNSLKAFTLFFLTFFILVFITKLGQFSPFKNIPKIENTLHLRDTLVFFFSPLLFFSIMLPVVIPNNGKVKWEEFPFLFLLIFPLIVSIGHMAKPQDFLPFIIAVTIFGTACLQVIYLYLTGVKMPFVKIGYVVLIASIIGLYFALPQCTVACGFNLKDGAYNASS